MKTLYVMRHGKAEDGFDKTDYKRKLNSKGIKRSVKVGLKLKDRKGELDTIICSSSLRTVETAEIMADFFDFPQADIKKYNELYLAPVNVILEYVYSLDDSVSNVLLVGHNPGLSELIGSLSRQLTDYLPTSALIALKIDIDKWEEISNANTKIVFSLFPKT